MKRRNISKFILSLLASFMLVITGINVNGSNKVVKAIERQVTYTITSKTAVSTSGTAPEGSTAEYSQTYGTTGQMIKDNSTTLTLKGYKDKTITGIILSMKSNTSKGAGTLSIKAGETELASISSATTFNKWYDNTTFTTSYKDINVTLTNNSYVISETDNIVIAIAATANSLYIQSYTLTYEEEDKIYDIYTATLHYNDDVTENSTISSASDTGLFTEPEVPTKDGYTFDAWYTDEVLENKFDFKNTTATANIDLYARWTNDACTSFVKSVKDTDIQAKLGYKYTKTIEDSYDTYALVTDASSLVSGDKIVITAAKSDFALSTTQKENNRGQEAITKNSENKTLETISSNVQVITLESGSTDGTFAFNVGTGYLFMACGSSTNNYLKTQDSIDANASWKITISENTASIIGQGTGTRNTLKYNLNNNLFSCYASGQQNVSIYKLTQGDKITGTTTKYSNVDFRIMFGIENSLISSLPEGATVQINIQTKPANKKTYDFTDEVDGRKVIVFTLGDLINEHTNAKTKFTLKLVITYDNEVYETTTREISVADLINTYYQDESTKDIVAEMYDYYTAQGYIS